MTGFANICWVWHLQVVMKDKTMCKEKDFEYKRGKKLN